jgi:hypothetical protein
VRGLLALMGEASSFASPSASSPSRSPRTLGKKLSEIALLIAFNTHARSPRSSLAPVLTDL